jgi:hypothetical protein
VLLRPRANDVSRRPGGAAIDAPLPALQNFD